MFHEVIPVGLLGCNCSILGDEATGEAVVIDPGDETERVLAILKEHNLKVKYLVATHAHIDHVGGLEKLKQVTQAPVLIHAEDLPLYQNLAAQALWLGVLPPGTTKVDEFLRDGQTLHCGKFSLEVLFTPGHSPGSVSLYLTGEHPHLFSGDTLFRGSIGRTDLWGGSYEQIRHSLKERLLVLEDSLPVFPGHGAETILGWEKECNPFLRGL